VHDRAGIGDRIRYLRTGREPKLTQRELAERAEVSVELISKLEQGVKQTALLTTLNKIARALDVDVSTLVARPVRVDTAPPDGGEPTGFLAIRRAITTTLDTAEPVSSAELTRLVTQAWGSYWANRFDTLSAILPGFIGAARATVRDTGSPRAYGALSDAYHIAASMLVHLHRVDLGYLAMERALNAAEQSGDQLRYSVLRGSLGWLVMHHPDNLAEARHIAVAEADRVEPSIRAAAPERIAVWGALLCRAATVAAREDNASLADDLANLAEVAATRLAGLGWYRSVHNQAPFGRPLVVMRMTEIAVITGRPGHALEVASRMPADAQMTLAERARHYADRAYAYMALGKLTEAERTLHTISRTAPQWMRYQSYPRSILRELWEQQRHTSTLRRLASRLNLALD
jgi:transcriptional regulator with XRE-family HTH domain